MAYQKKPKKEKAPVPTDLKSLLKAIKDKCGDGSLTVAKDYKPKPIHRISSGLLQVDHALGGGWPKGRVSLLVGEPSACKSRLAYAMIADAQKRSKINNKYLFEEMPEEERQPNVCLWLDFEGAHTNEWAESHGVDTDALLLARPENQEEGCEIILASLKSGQVDVVVVDSVDSMMPEEMHDQNFEEDTYGTKAAINNSRLFRKIQGIINDARKEDRDNLPTCIFLNHVKADLQRQGAKTYTGGVAQKFYASIIMEMRPGRVEYKDSQRKIPKHREYYFKVEKNKLGVPFRMGTFQMAVSDDEESGIKAGEFLELNAIMKMCQHFKILKQREDKSIEFFDDVYSSVAGFVEDNFADEQMELLTKRRLLEHFLSCD